MTEGKKPPEISESTGEMIFTNSIIAKLPDLKRDVEIKREVWLTLLSGFAESIDVPLDKVLERHGKGPCWTKEDKLGGSSRHVRFSAGTSKGKWGHIVSFSEQRRHGKLDTIDFSDVGSLVESVAVRTYAVEPQPEKFVYRDGLRVQTLDSETLIVPLVPSAIFDLLDKTAMKLRLSVYGETYDRETVSKLLGHVSDLLNRYSRRKDFTLLEINHQAV